MERNPAIILVEDEPDILIILHRLMQNLTSGYDVVTAKSGAEALAQVALRPVPLLITDFNMPGMNGLELARAVKEASPKTHIVLVTAYATPELERRARDTGINTSPCNSARSNVILRAGARNTAPHEPSSSNRCISPVGSPSRTSPR